MPQNNVTYTYGTASNTATNACGRLLRVDDGTGYQIFAYDRLGNVAENTRAIALPFEDSVYNFRMLYEYDSWNRVQRIVYPDSEVVTYNYDLGGQLYSVSAFKNNVSSSLINSILYDEFGHRTQVVFGNGITTNYTYDNLQRLSTLQTYSNNASLQKISYSFDYEDNITRVENTASGANGLGGGYTFDYQYDNLYRLTSSTGTFAPNGASYGLEMDFTPAGRVCRKFQDYTGTGNVYAYSQNSKQHAVRRIYNGLTNELYNLCWDNNGNLAQQTVYSVNNNVPTFLNMRMLFWDEDDRLNLVAGDGYLSYYAYGYDGNRAIKMTGNATIDQNGVLQNTSDLNNITIYPNEYLTVTQAEYTKYYYAGGNRIASKIGTGGFGKMQRLCTLDQGPTYNANTLLNFVLYQVTNTTQPPTDEYPVDVCAGYSVATELLTNPLPDFYISQTNLNFTQNNLLQQFRQNLTGGTEAVYFFHSDHLGSASWITSGTGGAVQHLLYLPFGEHFVNEQSTGYNERFTFTGKERDAETSYYYHGARFNSSDIGWLSVDPMSDKYPEITPYHYCHWNPIKLVDIYGTDDEDPPSISYQLNIENHMATLLQDNKVLATYDMSDDKQNQMLDEQVNKILSWGSSIACAVAIPGEKSKATFRLTNSKGKFDFKLYLNGWNGNQYVIPTKVASVAKCLGNIGMLFSILSTVKSGFDAYNATSLDLQVENTMDAFMGVLGFVPYVRWASFFYFLGGKDMSKWYNEKVITPMLQNGINPGLMIYQPYK